MKQNWGRGIFYFELGECFLLVRPRMERNILFSQCVQGSCVLGKILNETSIEISEA